MQRVGTIIFRQRVFLAIERELSVADAISIASNQSAKIGALVKVAGERIESQRYIGKLPCLIGGLYRDDNSAIRHHADFDAVRVRQRIKLDGFPVERIAESFFLDHVRSRRRRRCNARSGENQ